ncbi:MAG: putative rane transporter protein [Magnetococcales bacterium]|nr:putative rane transporter protein [Magnetococcales bacterium]HIJ82835.1 sulfite exporter TauE/SafE family protein [Magnetococcales bacterium]
MLPDLPWFQLLSAWLAVGVGAMIQGTIGFGIALIAAPLLLLIQPDLIPGPMMFATFFLTSLTWWRERTEVRWQNLTWAWGGRVTGTLAGTAAMVAIPSELLVSTMGLLIVVASVMSANTRPFQPSHGLLIVAGFLSGLIGTMTSAGGPPMILAFQHVSGPRLRATLGAFFSIGIVISLISLSFIHRFGTREALLGLSFVPPILLGFYLSNRLLPVVNKDLLRRLALIFSAGSGLMIVMGSLSRWFFKNFFL